MLVDVYVILPTGSYHLRNDFDLIVEYLLNSDLAYEGINLLASR
jgi:hypothetical protein